MSNNNTNNRRSVKIEDVELVVMGTHNGGIVLEPKDKILFEEKLRTVTNWGSYLHFRQAWNGRLPALDNTYQSEFVILAQDRWRDKKWRNKDGELESGPVEGELWLCNVNFYRQLHGIALAVPIVKLGGTVRNRFVYMDTHDVSDYMKSLGYEWNKVLEEWDHPQIIQRPHNKKPKYVTAQKSIELYIKHINESREPRYDG